MAPPLFADLCKTTNELFVKDYKDFNPKVEISATVLNGTPFKATLSQSSGAFNSELEFKRKLYDFDFTGKVTAKKAVTLTAENSTLVSNLKLKAEYPLGSKPKLTGEYKAKDFTAAVAFDVEKSSTDLSLTSQFSSLLFGASSTYAKGKFSPPVVKAQYNAEGYEIGASVEKFGGKIGLSMFQNINSTLGLAATAEQSDADLSLSLGGSFVPDKETSVRGKVDSKGIVSTLYTQKICPSTTLKLLGQIDTLKLADGNAHKFGFNVVVKV